MNLRELNVERPSKLGGSNLSGRRGAGVIFRARDTGRYLLALRSSYVLEPNTWSTWGGLAKDERETARETAEREAREETGYAGDLKLKELWTYKRGGFSYTNFLAIVPREFKPKLDWETRGYRWVRPGEWPEPLHPGVRALLRRIKLA